MVMHKLIATGTCTLYLCHNRSERFISLLRGLSPCYLRIGGTEAQGLTFNATTGTADEELVVTRPAGGGEDVNNSTVSVLSDWDPPYLEDKFANFTIHGKNTLTKTRAHTTTIVLPNKFCRVCISSQICNFVEKPFTRSCVCVTLISGKIWDDVNQFAVRGGAHVIFDVNDMKRQDGRWSDVNFRQLLDFTVSRPYAGNLGFELGNGKFKSYF